WVMELLDGHPDCICSELGIDREVFRKLIRLLKNNGYVDPKHILIEEQLAIFLY
ncbi:hypothetical protein SERLA73DRAFT_27924, partial [Serpula lacrymans var. lacrymans S7.3]